MWFANLADARIDIEQGANPLRPFLEGQSLLGANFLLCLLRVDTCFLKNFLESLWRALQEFLAGSGAHQVLHLALQRLPVLDVVQFVSHSDGTLRIVVEEPKQPVCRLLAESGVLLAFAQTLPVERVESLDDGLLALGEWGKGRGAGSKRIAGAIGVLLPLATPFSHFARDPFGVASCSLLLTNARLSTAISFAIDFVAFGVEVGIDFLVFVEHVAPHRNEGSS